MKPSMFSSKSLTRAIDALAARPWAFLCAVIAAMLAVHGANQSDLIDYLIIAPDTTQTLIPAARQFEYSSPLNFMLGDFLGMPNAFGFYFIHIGEIIAMVGVILHCLRNKFPVAEDRTRFLALLALTPFWLVVLKWIGKPDPLLISMMFLCWAYPGKWRWLCATFMVMAHREMGVLMCLMLFWCDEKKDFRLLAAILIGCGFHYVYENEILDPKPVSRMHVWAGDIWEHPREFLAKPALYIFASFSWYWLAVLWQRPGWRIGLGMLAAFGIAVACEDFTRDFMMVALIPLLFHAENIVRNGQARPLMRFLPLALVQIQIAAKGIVFKPENFWFDWVKGFLS